MLTSNVPYGYMRPRPMETKASKWAKDSLLHHYLFPATLLQEFVVTLVSKEIAFERLTLVGSRSILLSVYFFYSRARSILDLKLYNDFIVHCLPVASYLHV